MPEPAAESRDLRPLVVDQFLGDPEVRTALSILVERLREHQGALDGIRPPQAGRREAYESLMDTFGESRGGRLFFPYLGSGIGNGSLVELADGSVKYDMITGIGVHLFGHSDPDLISATVKAGLSDSPMQGNLQQNIECAPLARQFLEAANASRHVFDHVFFTTTGVMAGENSLKIAFQQRHPADRVLAFERCFAGRTLALSSITDKAAYRVGLPQALAVDYVPFFDAEDPEGSTRRALEVLGGHLGRYPGRHAAMFFELIQGEGGFYPGEQRFHRALMEACRDHGVHVLCDEVQSFGRTTSLFAYQYYGLDDLVDGCWIGKASQVCASFFKKEHAPKPGLISQTFTGSSTALAAASVILEKLQQGGYLGEDGRIAAIHQRFRERLESMEARYPDWISGPWGVGGMLAFTPFGGEPERVKRFVHRLFEAGVISFIAGANPVRCRFLVPSGVIRDAEIEAVCDIVETVLREEGERGEI